MLSPRLAPVVDVRETADEMAVTALESWIPAGRINRFVWSWVEHSGPFGWSGIVKTAALEHEFVLPKPPGVTNRSQVCLRIEGSVIEPNGAAFFLGAGSTCMVPVPEAIMHVPSWWDPVMVPLWRPGVAIDGVLSDAIAAHVSVQSDDPARAALSSNALVYFPDAGDAPLAWLGEALKQIQRRGVSLVMFVVLPVGTLGARRRDSRPGWDRSTSGSPRSCT